MKRKTSAAAVVVASSPRPYGGQARLYDHEYRDFTSDIGFYLERLRENRVRKPILELASGTGRVSIPLSAAGYRVTGLDNSEPMIARARRKRSILPFETAVRLRFTRQDMTDFHFRKRFGAILVPFSSLSLLPTGEARRKCLSGAFAHLEADGILLIDLPAPARGGATSKEGPRTFRRFFKLPTYGGSAEKEVTELEEPGREALRVTYRYRIRRYPDGPVQEDVTVAFDFARIDRETIEREVDLAGFETEALFGDYQGSVYGPTSDRLIVEARRR